MEKNPQVEKHPEMTFDGACHACGGDMSVRFTGKRATGICTSCGYVSIAAVSQEGERLVFEQIVRAAA
jgi:uncharacterized Zn finger protein